VPDWVALTFPLLAPGTDFAGFRIAEMVGRGGMGVVYRAVDAALERTVALKVIAPEHTEDPAVVSRFKSEAKLAASIDHPNLVTIYGAGECEGVLFLAMRFVPGTDLRSVIAEHGPLELPRINRIVEQVASALDAAHARGHCPS
jgi:serine/threonine protein kinase